MAALPPIRTSSSTPMDFMSFMKSQGLGKGLADMPNGGNGAHEATNLRRMIDELERTRGRYESEKSSALQFGKQMDMLSKQIGSLSEQQQSLLGFHIVRINSMIEDLRKSADSIDRDRLQKELERREREDRARRERLDREEREARERRERLEKQEREREREREREQELVAAAERARQEILRQQFLKSPTSSSNKLSDEASSSLPPTAAASSSSSSTASSSSALPPPEDINMANLPNMDMGDMKSFPEFVEFMKRQQQSKDYGNTASTKRHSIGPTSSSALDTSIPAPSRTVSPTSQKRRRSVPVANADTNNGNPLSSSSSGAAASPTNKRAKLSAADDTAVEVLSSLNRKRVSAEQVSTDNDAMSDDEATAAALDDATARGTTALDDALPPELQAQLQAQALAMLQAQMEQQEVEKCAMDTSADDNPIAPPKELTPQREQDKQPQRCATAAKPTAAAIKAEPQPISTSSSASSVPKPKPKPKKKTSAVKKEKSAGKGEPVQAVEDTTIANPETVPLKNKAIHQWMAKDPERLYTADDIVAAGIRYRQPNNSHGKLKGRIYILNDRKHVRSALLNFSKKLWESRGKGEWKYLSEPLPVES